MSWLLNLYNTYKENREQVGIIGVRRNGKEYTLLPVSHTTQNAHIEVTVDSEGNFLKAVVIDKSDSSTLIPCTEASASRTSTTIAPYPIHDKLIYVAGDYNDYVQAKKQREHYQKYVELLGEWAHSPYAVSKVKSIYRYVSKGGLMRDLIEEGVLTVDSSKKLISKWDSKYAQFYPEKPQIFSAVTAEQESAFVRFTVHEAGQVSESVWKDNGMYASFIQFYELKLGNRELCYVTGEYKPSTDKHANKIRNAGDKAKLISANDTSGFTFRGRFDESGEAARISYDVSQKAHNALKWLINRQGKIIDNRVFLVWGNNKVDIPDIADDSVDVLEAFLETDQSQQHVQPVALTYREFAEEFNKALRGHRLKLLKEMDEARSRINILLLDSATPGRMAVLYYRNLDVQHYFQRIENWHAQCAWLHRYRKDKSGFEFYGAPSTKDIAFAAYGSKANDKVVKGLMERVLPCIIDNKRLPGDIVRSAVQRASNPQSMERWEWEKTLSITCALIKSVTGGYDMALDHSNDDRSYLFGRLLALADILERRVLREQDVNRATNALRYMNSFARYPERTWKTIQASLQPYQVRLGARSTDISKVMDEVLSKFNFEQFNNEPLSGKFLLGFSSQRHDWYQRSKTEEDKQEELGEL